MKLLLDTHAFLWWDNEPSRLSPQVLALCQDPTTDLVLSVVSVWEIQIKSALGKLTLTTPLHTLITAQHTTNGLQVLPVTLEHVLALDSVPAHHKDPFDRLLIAQARVEAIPVASADRVFALYPVSLVW